MESPKPRRSGVWFVDLTGEDEMPVRRFGSFGRFGPSNELSAFNRAYGESYGPPGHEEDPVLISSNDDWESQNSPSQDLLLQQTSDILRQLGDLNLDQAPRSNPPSFPPPLPPLWWLLQGPPFKALPSLSTPPPFPPPLLPWLKFGGPPSMALPKSSPPPALSKPLPQLRNEEPTFMALPKLRAAPPVTTILGGGRLPAPPLRAADIKLGSKEAPFEIKSTNDVVRNTTRENVPLQQVSDALTFFCDGSYISQMWGGSGVAWFEGDQWHGKAYAAGVVNEPFDSEALAIIGAMKAAREVQARSSSQQQDIKIYSDSQDVLISIDRLDKRLGLPATQSRQILTGGILTGRKWHNDRGREVSLVWVKGHHLCAGNELADSLAKHGAEESKNLAAAGIFVEDCVEVPVHPTVYDGMVRAAIAKVNAKKRRIEMNADLKAQLRAPRTAQVNKDMDTIMAKLIAEWQESMKDVSARETAKELNRKIRSLRKYRSMLDGATAGPAVSRTDHALQAQFRHDRKLQYRASRGQQ